MPFVGILSSAWPIGLSRSRLPGCLFGLRRSWAGYFVNWNRTTFRVVAQKVSHLCSELWGKAIHITASPSRQRCSSELVIWVYKCSWPVETSFGLWSLYKGFRRAVIVLGPAEWSHILRTRSRMECLWPIYGASTRDLRALNRSFLVGWISCGCHGQYGGP